MSRHLPRIVARYWRVGLALTSLVAFALAGSAHDPMPG